MKLRNVLHEEHAGTATLEFVLILVLCCAMVFAVVNTPWPGAGGRSLTGIIHDRIRTVINYITNNNNAANDIWTS